jgi:hypothetical protein
MLTVLSDRGRDSSRYSWIRAATHLRHVFFFHASSKIAGFRVEGAPGALVGTNASNRTSTGTGSGSIPSTGICTVTDTGRSLDTRSTKVCFIPFFLVKFLNFGG